MRLFVRKPTVSLIKIGPDKTLFSKVYLFLGTQWKCLEFFFQQKILIFLHKNIRCGYILEVPQWGASNEYPQHMFSCKNKKNISTFRLKKRILSRAMWHTFWWRNKKKVLFWYLCYKINGKPLDQLVGPDDTTFKLIYWLIFYFFINPCPAEPGYTLPLQRV